MTKAIDTLLERLRSAGCDEALIGDVRRAIVRGGERLGRISRADARAQDCPTCGAPSGAQCVGSKGKPRLSPHAARIAEERRARRS